MTVEELLLLGVVVFCGGWLAHDEWARTNQPVPRTARQHPTAVRIIPAVVDWQQNRWL